MRPLPLIAPMELQLQIYWALCHMHLILLSKGLGMRTKPTALLLTSNCWLFHSNSMICNWLTRNYMVNCLIYATTYMKHSKQLIMQRCILKWHVLSRGQTIRLHRSTRGLQREINSIGGFPMGESWMHGCWMMIWLAGRLSHWQVKVTVVKTYVGWVTPVSMNITNSPW